MYGIFPKQSPVGLMPFTGWICQCTRLNNLIIFRSGHVLPLPLNGSNASQIALKHRIQQISTSRLLSADLDPIRATVSVWEGGSTVKRITQNSPEFPNEVLSHSMPTLFIHPSIYRPLFRSLLPPSPSVCYLCLSSSFHPSRRLYCPSVTCFPYPSPFFLSPTT